MSDLCGGERERGVGLAGLFSGLLLRRAAVPLVGVESRIVPFCRRLGHIWLFCKSHFLFFSFLFFSFSSLFFSEQVGIREGARTRRGGVMREEGWDVHGRGGVLGQPGGWGRAVIVGRICVCVTGRGGWVSCFRADISLPSMPYLP